MTVNRQTICSPNGPQYKRSSDYLCAFFINARQAEYTTLSGFCEEIRGIIVNVKT